MNADKCCDTVTRRIRRHNRIRINDQLPKYKHCKVRSRSHLRLQRLNILFDSNSAYWEPNDSLTHLKHPSAGVIPLFVPYSVSLLFTLCGEGKSHQTNAKMTKLHDKFPQSPSALLNHLDKLNSRTT